MTKLRISHPAIGSLIVPIDVTGLIVGREGGHADLEMNWDHRVSRRHARFWMEDEQVWFEDLGSRNGTWDAQRRIEGRELLQPERVVLVGETSFAIAGEGEDVGPRGVDLERIDEIIPDGGLFDEDTLSFARLPDDHLPGPSEPQVIVQDIPMAAAVIIEDVPADPPPRQAPPPPAPARPKSRAAPAAVIVEDVEPLPPIAAEPKREPRSEPKHEAKPEPTHEPKHEPKPEPKPEPRAAPRPETKPKPKSEPKQVLRNHPRFSSERKVQLKVGERDELRTLWTENISKGGLYVKTESPPPRGTIVEVTITTPDGELILNAEVVHVVDAASASATGQTAGVGLQFVNLTAEARASIHRYVDGLAPRLDSVSGASMMPASAAARPSIDKTLARAKDFIAAVEANDLYKALGLGSKATGDQIQGAIAELGRAFAEAEASATPPQLARLQAAKKLLDRTSSLLSSAERRLEYDFRHGDIRAEERLALAKQKKGPSASELRGTWHRALPGRLEKALELLRQAIAAKKARDIMEAIRLGRAALDLDPFHEELRQTVDAWQATSEKK